MTRLEEIKARCDKATPGPWKIIDKGNSVKSFAVVSESFVGVPQQMICPNMSPKTSNAEFIARSREDIPYLLELLDKAVAEIHSIAYDADRYCRTCKWDMDGKANKECLEEHCYKCGYANPTDENYDYEIDDYRSNWQWRGETQ